VKEKCLGGWVWTCSTTVRYGDACTADSCTSLSSSRAITSSGAAIAAEPAVSAVTADACSADVTAVTMAPSPVMRVATARGTRRNAIRRHDASSWRMVASRAASLEATAEMRARAGRAALQGEEDGYVHKQRHRHSDRPPGVRPPLTENRNGEGTKGERVRRGGGMLVICPG